MDDMLKNLGLLVIGQTANLILSFPTMWCWNHVMPVIFKLPSITYWQMFCLMFVCTMTIKGYRYIDKA